jgi:hypothetical protein
MPEPLAIIPSPSDAKPGRATRFRAWVIALLLVAGLYAPTSIDEAISRDLLFAASILLFVLLAALLFHRRGLLGRVSLLWSAVIVFDVLFFTLISPFTEFAYGAVRSFALLAVVFCLRLQDVPLNAWTRRLFHAANVINIACALAIVAEVPEVNEFLVQNYSAAYQELVRYMLDERKPVLTFGSHALAGFFFYLFFYMNFETFRARQGRRYLVIALAYVGLMICLNSVSGYGFAVLAAMSLIREFFWNRSLLATAVAGLFLLTSVGIAATQLGILEFQKEFIDTLNSDTNGLNGRYSQTGVLTRNLNFLADHPFSPIGLGYSDSLFYGDSGPVEYLIRGGFPLVIATYAGLYLFLRDNLRSRKQCRLLFAVFLVFEVGYSNLHYLRTLYLLPFVVVYLNGIGQAAEAAYPRLRSREARAC